MVGLRNPEGTASGQSRLRQAFACSGGFGPCARGCEHQFELKPWGLRMRAEAREKRERRDLLRFDRMSRFVSDLPLSKREQSTILGISPERLDEIYSAPRISLTTRERFFIETFDAMIINGLAFFLNWEEMCVWFREQFHRTGRDADTPAPPMNRVGRASIFEINRTLEVQIYTRALQRLEFPPRPNGRLRGFIPQDGL